MDAVTYLGHEEITSDSTGDHAITVPADCNCILINYSIYAADNDDLVSANIGGANFTRIVTLPSSSGLNVSSGLWMLVNPPVGSQTLSLAYYADNDNTATCVTYWKGVYTDTPIRDFTSQTASSSHGTTQQITTNPLNGVAGDMAVAAIGSRNTTPECDAAPGGSGQTQASLAVIDAGSSYTAIGYKPVLADGEVTVTAIGMYPALCGITLACSLVENPATDLGGVTSLGVYTFSSDTTGNHTLHVPAGCTFMLLSYGFYFSTGYDLVSASLNGTPLTKIDSIPGVSSFNYTGGHYYIANPSTGVQTLATAFTSDFNGAYVIVSYWANVDTTNPIRSHAACIAPSSYQNVQTITTDAMTAKAKDLAVATFSFHSAGSRTSIGDQVELVSNARISVGYKIITEDGDTTLSGNGDFPALCGFILAAASADPIILKYKTAATEGGIAAASWQTYTGAFASSGYVKLRAEVA